ncbi:MAG TPA: glycosyltransferase family 2 protein [Phycisphaerae bacterium]|nr:glycosyltransferase family 2 protein [Phycisphaerae bacterium]HOJ74999.1 glycosyltransferase family 2 protein [Phycisphaerae bacterium]HOM51560.1 glycosyltransferase family 2 protein [Phycisphaerae bacterium]HON67652.1 glycosyltransferase family 2 protein [Phycisphaerae bacterium]HOQ85472.1 glycosyltransferase family 2 protein [Phycisphaerae bacterium]
MSTTVAIVIPAYNEARRITTSLAEVNRFSSEYSRVVEVIVVDDGSSDDTAARVEAAAKEADHNGGPRLQLVRHPSNRGKGAAVRTGFQQATAEIVLFSDADLSAPIDEVPRLVEPIAAGECDITIGSRALDPSFVQLQQSLLRRNAGRVFNLMVRLSTGLPLQDTQCGFKAFRRTAAQPIFDAQRIDGFAFDVELLYLARRAGLRIRELPVHWSHAEGSKVSMSVHTWQMARDLLRIRWNDWRGRYGTLLEPAPTNRDVTPSPVGEDMHI